MKAKFEIPIHIWDGIKYVPLGSVEAILDIAMVDLTDTEGEKINEAAAEFVFSNIGFDPPKYVDLVEEPKNANPS